MINVAINGYGRIGRNVHRQFEDRFGDSVQVVGINASTSSEMRAYLLKYDSLHRKFKGEISVKDENNIIVNGKTVRVVKEKDPSKCPWKELDVDIVVEATGKFRTRELANGHLLAGAKRVIVTA
ncbi:MAG: glyceraldehyde 3-phosphate dehydrogenase N-terminal domain-containing protein, partial [Candidatus Peribacteraceae bacterium]|nr:glyceraldehyde 3-phosphate dehydrogenase N-terminal domain-containing protein [Candidatus Peribacteraceae bacterium]